jgi:hypothetical protein
MSGGLYVKLQADYSDDPKIIRAGEAAEVLYVRMLCFCARTLSDGLVDDAQMTRLGSTYQLLARCSLAVWR